MNCCAASNFIVGLWAFAAGLAVDMALHAAWMRWRSKRGKRDR
jgi:hypothetical protein